MTQAHFPNIRNLHLFIYFYLCAWVISICVWEVLKINEAPNGYLMVYGRVLVCSYTGYVYDLYDSVWLFWK